MPTRKKRVGFIPREDVMKIIEKLSIENNLSNSKVISILVEEALSIRGIFNKKNGKIAQSYQTNNNHSKISSNNSADFADSAKVSFDSLLENHFNPPKLSQLNEANSDIYDLETYKKFLSFLKFQEMMEKYNS